MMKSFSILLLAVALGLRAADEAAFVSIPLDQAGGAKALASYPPD
jgi:hypothetical protein